MYIQYTTSQYKKANNLKLSQIGNYGICSKRPKNEFEPAVVNEPSVFEPFKFYCSYIFFLSDKGYERKRSKFFLLDKDFFQNESVCALSFILANCLTPPHMHQVPSKMSILYLLVRQKDYRPSLIGSSSSASLSTTSAISVFLL